MRLTIHHSHEILPIWQNSLEKLLATHQLTVQDALAMGDWHLATFNDRVVGLSITHAQNIVYFSVRDLTRRRGIGRYLMAETIKYFIGQNINQIEVNGSAVQPEELEGLSAFLSQAGFQMLNKQWVLTL